MAAHLGTNPVVVRRTLAGLRKEGIVTSIKGHGGGWTVALPPGDVTLRQIYEALAEPGALMAEPDSDTHGCQIQAVVNDALAEFHAEAQALLLRRLDAYTLADLSADLHRRLAARMADVIDVPTS
jgi:DNA-binding IscR family transcriptional regulator